MREGGRRSAVVKMKNAGAEIELKKNVSGTERYNGRGEGERREKGNREGEIDILIVILVIVNYGVGYYNISFVSYFSVGLICSRLLLTP